MKLQTTLLLGALCMGSESVLANIDIVFDYSYDASSYFGTTQKNLLDSAASAFETRFSNSLNAITSVGTNNFDVSFLNPSSGVV